MRKQLCIPLREWAEAEGISYSTALNLVHEERLSARRLGRYWYVIQEVDTPHGGGVALTLFVHAGGAGKSTLARDLGYELASRGKRVLLVDVDPQANLSAWLGVVEVDPAATVLGLLEGKHDLTPQNVLPGVDLIPAHIELARADLLLGREAYKLFSLRSYLDRQRQHYDLILVDSLPSLGSLAGLAGMAGDGMLVPIELSAKGVQALPTVLGVARDYAVGLSEMRMNYRGIVGIIPTNYDRTTRGRLVLENLEQTVGGKIQLLPPLAYRPAVYREAQERCVPAQTVGGPEVVADYRQLGDALESIIAKMLEAAWAE